MADNFDNFEYMGPQGEEKADLRHEKEYWLNLLESQKTSTTPSDSPFFHSDPPPEGPIFIPSRAEKILGQKDTQIVFGRDRSGNLASGKGAYGPVSGSATIDMVVGRGASGAGTKPGMLIHNNFFSDAARIYISRNTSADKNFDLAPGKVGTINEGSAVVLKADNIRLIGRGGIKIVTGKSPRTTGFGATGETLSTGKPCPIAAPIDLIAGNNTSIAKVKGAWGASTENIPSLQPVVKGKNLEHGLQELINIVGELWSAVFNLGLIQTGFNGVVGVDPYRPWVASAVVPVTNQQLTSVINSLYHTRVKAMFWEIDYLYRYGYKYICSSNVNAN